jgi:excisionase family DNA binding protein
MNRLFSTKKLAEYLDMAPLTVRRKAKRGEIPSIKIGNRLRFDKQHIDRWLLERSNRRPVRILVVDDEQLIIGLFKETFEVGGYQLTTALSSLEALEIIKQKQFDLIFLDLLMPELDGGQLLKYIRETDKDVPVVIVTGYPDSEVMKRAMEYGPFSVIKKPFKIDEILSVVRSFAKGVGNEILA